MSKALRYLAAVVGSLLTASVSAFNIGTSSQWNGSDSISYIGNPITATATYGQTFRVSEPATISSWTFWLSNRSNSPQPEVRLDGFLAEWSTDRAIASPLYENTGRVVPTSPRGEFHTITFSLPDIPLDPAKTYIMFLNTSPYSTLQQPYELAALGSTGNVYAGGSFWYQSSNNLFANVYNFPWACGDEGSGCRYGDAAFEAAFAPIPEPSSALLTAIGIAFLLRLKRNAA
jgi:hypothetical protein